MPSSSTITLQRTINLASQFNRNAPLVFTPNNDPAFSNADWVRQFILGAPFAWNFNRAEITPIVMDMGVSDYTQNLPNFDRIEKADLFLPVANGGVPKSIELAVKEPLARELQISQPAYICAYLNDGAGNITFRVSPSPDQRYTLQLTYQKTAPTFVNVTDTWAPIPDWYSFLYNQGMLAKTYEYLGDARFGEALITFLRQVIAANHGFLDENQKNLFLADKLANVREQIDSTGSAQSARIGRGLFQG